MYITSLFMQPKKSQKMRSQFKNIFIVVKFCPYDK